MCYVTIRQIHLYNPDKIHVIFSKMILYLLKQSRDCMKTWEARLCSLCSIWTSSSVTDMAVRSFPLLQLVIRIPCNLRHNCNIKTMLQEIVRYLSFSMKDFARFLIPVYFYRREIIVLVYVLVQHPVWSVFI